MYRDEPMDDEQELRDLVGDDQVDRIVDDEHALGTALDVLRVLQGWVDDDHAASWLTTPARRLDGRTPIEALAGGDGDEVEDACRAHVAALS